MAAAVAAAMRSQHSRSLGLRYHGCSHALAMRFLKSRSLEARDVALSWLRPCSRNAIFAAPVLVGRTVQQLRCSCGFEREREREGERGREKEGGREREWRMVEGEMDIYIYIYIHIYINIYIYIYTNIFTRVYVYVYIYITLMTYVTIGLIRPCNNPGCQNNIPCYIPLVTDLVTYHMLLTSNTLYIYVYIYICIYIYIYVYAYTYVYMHVYMYIYIQIHMCIYPWLKIKAMSAPPDI
jgi:hypothetical protein